MNLYTINSVIIKIAISSIVIGLKNSYFPLILFAFVVIRQFVFGQFCYRTVQ